MDATEFKDRAAIAVFGACLNMASKLTEQQVNFIYPHFYKRGRYDAIDLAAYLANIAANRLYKERAKGNENV